MKRTATLLASLALTLGLGVGLAPAASAEDPLPCDAACVEALRDENQALRNEVDKLKFDLLIANGHLSDVESKLAATQLSLQYAYGAAQRLLDQFEFQQARALERRATIIELRHFIRVHC